MYLVNGDYEKYFVYKLFFIQFIMNNKYINMFLK